MSQYRAYFAPGGVDPSGLQFRMERHHWFARKGDTGEVGQKLVDRFCKPNGSFNIHDFTTPMLGGQKGTVHDYIENTLQYGLQYDAIVASTKDCDCCGFLKKVAGLMLYNWTIANALAEHKPAKGVYGHELQSPWPKLERWKDPGARGNPNTPDMLGNFIQEIINRCNITDENEIKKPQTLHYKIPEGILKENVIAPEIQLPYSIPNLPVVLPNGTTRPYEFPNPGGFSVWTFDDGRVLRADPIRGLQYLLLYRFLRGSGGGSAQGQPPLTRPQPLPQATPQTLPSLAL